MQVKMQPNRKREHQEKDAFRNDGKDSVIQQIFLHRNATLNDKKDKLIDQSALDSQAEANPPLSVTQPNNAWTNNYYLQSSLVPVEGRKLEFLNRPTTTGGSGTDGNVDLKDDIHSTEVNCNKDISAMNIIPAYYAPFSSVCSQLSPASHIESTLPSGSHRLIFATQTEAEYFSYYRQTQQQLGFDYYGDIVQSSLPCKLSKIQGFSLFVPGRLSLLSSTCKYKVSISEIHRRISQPECLNASLLGGILRRAKSKNGGKYLRDRLEGIGVRLPAGRRKSASITVLTAMVEGEAIQLASDFKSVCRTDFPTLECAHYTRKRKFEETQCDCTTDQLIRDIKIARKMTEEFADIIDSDRSPVLSKSECLLLPNEVQAPLTRFSMLTHGFGCSAVSTGVHVYLSYLQQLESSLTAQFDKPTSLAPNDDVSQWFPLGL